jgi:hypothetical protein
MKLDGKDTAIEEAVMSEANGHVYFAIPKDKFPRFQNRISRGVAGERMWRQLDQGLRELEARKTAPAAKSDVEIECELTLEVLKPHLAELMDERDIENLELRIDKAKNDAAKAYATAEGERVAKASEPTWEEQQVSLIAKQVLEIVAANETLRGLSKEELEEVYEKELLPIRNGLVWLEGDAPMGNTQYIYDRLSARAKSAAGRKAEATTDTSKTPAPKPETPSVKAGDSQVPARKTAADAADRFNRGVDAAKKPGTTSVKANRDRPAKNGATRHDEPETKAPRKSLMEEQAEAEDDLRRTTRSFMGADGFDFEVAGADAE